MSIIILIISAGILLALLMLHSYLTRGIRITITFFLLAFVLMFYKEVIRPLFSNINLIQFTFPRGYESLIKDTPQIISQLAIVVGWMITFYLSWCFSEQILLRFNNFKKRLFTTLVFSLIVTVTISYCMETMGVNMCWWTWYFYLPELENFFLNFPIDAIQGWMHMSFIFLLSFFLIECSKYKLTNWKGIFFLIYLMPVWFILFFGFENYLITVDFVIINIIFFSFFNTLEIEYGTIQPINSSLKFLQYVNQIPLIVVLLILLFVTIGELFFLRQPSLLISTIPLLTIILLSIKRLSLFYILILSIGSFIIMKEKAIFSLIPVGFAIMVWAFDRIYRLVKIPSS